MRIGDVVTAQGFPEDYPLMVLAIAGGRVAMGSPRWPKGATRVVEPDQITSINGQPCQFPQAQIKQTRRRKAA
jgi:hypothetical protein